MEQKESKTSNESKSRVGSTAKYPLAANKPSYFTLHFLLHTFERSLKNKKLHNFYIYYSNLIKFADSIFVMIIIGHTKTE